MKKISLATSIFLLFPLVTHAQNLINFVNNTISFISNALIPFLLAIGFLIFVINATRYFVLEGSNEDGRKKAKALAIYSVSAFVLLIIFWGIVTMLASSIGLEGRSAPNSDYMEENGYGRDYMDDRCRTSPNSPGCQTNPNTA